MSEVNTTKFYQFLSKYQADGGWDKVADGEYGNEDGTVIKSEFRKFLNGEWNGEENGELTNDLINSFWKKIDTNTSASKIAGTKVRNLNGLDKNEIANLEKRLEVYVQFDEFLANNITIPSALTSTGSQWKSDVTNELSAILEKFIAGGYKGDLNTLLTEAYPSIANKCTAQYCAVEYQETLKNGILADYPDYKVADDSTMQNLILAYIETIDAETDADAIKEEIMSIMDAYLATAGLGEDSAYPLEDLGFDASKLNDIQIAVITQTIKNDLADDAKNYEGYETEFNEAVKQFIEAKIKEGGSFEDLKGAATEFANSKFKQQLDNTVTINTTYRDVKEDSDFYNRLVEEFGETLAKKIAQNDRYIQAYKDIINDIAAKVNAGEMTMDEVADYVIEQISANLEKFFANGLGDMSLEELNATYDKLAASADAQTDDEVSLTQHREAAIKYCDALAKKSDKLKEAVIEAFGDSNYKSAINNMLPGEIQEIMEELKAKALEIGDITKMTEAEKNALFSNINDSYKLSMGEIKSFNIANSATCEGFQITSDRLSYKASGCVTVDNSGKVTINTSKAGTYSGEVTVYIDGIKIASKVITIEISNQVSASAIVNNVKEWAGTYPEGVTVMYKANGNNAGDSLTSSTFKDLYNNDNIICLGAFRDNDKYNWGRDGEEVIKARLTSLGSYVVDTLATANSALDKDILTRAMNNVVNKYAINPTGDYYQHKDSGDTAANFYNYMTDNKNKVKNGLVQSKDNDGDDSNVYGIYFKEFVDAIITEYNRLKG